MVIPLEELGRHEFALFNIEALHRRPTYRALTIRHRARSGFLYMVKGSCTLQAQGEALCLCRGNLVYLPYGSQHTLRLDSEDVEFYRVSFNVKTEDEIVLFSNCPTKLSDTLDQDCREIILALTQASADDSGTVLKYRHLCALFDALCHAPSALYASKLGAAVRYLEEHFTERIDCRLLASLCFLSTAQFYNLFRAQVGCTPLEYRDRLLLRRARALLGAGELSVGEVAALLGFSDAAYFSRFFKKHTSLSPSLYAKEHQEL